jgi:hypothetical protein
VNTDSKFLNPAGLGIVFQSANQSGDSESAETKAVDNSKSLMLHELLEAILLTTLNLQLHWRVCRKKVKTDSANAGKEATELAERYPADFSPYELIVNVWNTMILPQMSKIPNALHYANDYRRHRLYKRKVDNMLHVHLRDLKVVFNRYAVAPTPTHTHPVHRSPASLSSLIHTTHTAPVPPPRTHHTLSHTHHTHTRAHTRQLSY